MPPMPPTPRLRRKRRPTRFARFNLFAGVLMHHYCDACGHSKTDGKPLTIARFRVKLPTGELFFCGHHFRKHRAHIAEKTYETYEVK